MPRGHERAAFSLVALARHRRQGIHPDAARPAHLRHDGRHPADAADAVRLRDQLRPQASARPRCSSPTTARSRGRMRGRAAATATTSTSSREAPDRGRGRPAARAAARCSSWSPSRRTSRRDLLRGERPALLVEADATDPAATSNAIGGAATALRRRRSRDDLNGPLAPLARSPAPVELRVHAPLQPRGASPSTTSCPGLMGVVLTMTMVMITGAGHHPRARARHDGEPARPCPARPLEVMIGKIMPYILVGYIQVALILLAAQFLFHVPMRGQPRPAARRACSSSSPPTWRWASPSRRSREPAAGDADDVLLLPAVDPAVRLHVPLPRHARLGADDRRGAAADPLPAHRPRHPAEGQRHRRDAARGCGRSRLFMLVVMALGLRAFRSTLD